MKLNDDEQFFLILLILLVFFTFCISALLSLVIN